MYKLYYTSLDRDNYPADQSENFSTLDEAFEFIKTHSFRYEPGWGDTASPYCEERYTGFSITEFTEVDLYDQNSPEIKNILETAQAEVRGKIDSALAAAKAQKLAKEHREYARLKKQFDGE